MNPEQKQKIQALAEAEIRHSFQFIKNQTDKEGKDLVVYYYDFFAAYNAGITRQDMEKYEQSDDYDPKYGGLLNAIWSGYCQTYEGDFVPMSKTAENWIDGQPALYREAYELVKDLDYYGNYNQIRADFEQCVIDALKKCDEEGVFGNRKENGLILFAFYSDDYNENGEGSLLYRSAEALNDENSVKKLI